jgi:chromosome segregation ATPase
MSGGEKSGRASAPGPQSEQSAAEVDALRRRIAELQAQQKETIHRLSTQRVSVEEVGVELEKLEKELSVAKEQLRRMVHPG